MNYINAEALMVVAINAQLRQIERWTLTTNHCLRTVENKFEFRGSQSISPRANLSVIPYSGSRDETLDQTYGKDVEKRKRTSNRIGLFNLTKPEFLMYDWAALPFHYPRNCCTANGLFESRSYKLPSMV
ncbi:MAG: hypothetical protein OXG24_04410 [Gammaproteobacteria bacterium]|nr:hypothetical protein [Gammaproteobacteria bacterium]